MLLLFSLLLLAASASSSQEPFRRAANFDKAITITNANFDEMAQGSWFLLVTEPQCKECRGLEQMLGSVQSIYGTQLKTATLNADDNQVAAARLFIYKFPSLFFIKEGQVYEFLSSRLDPSAAVDFIDEGHEHVKPMSKITNPFGIPGQVLWFCFYTGQFFTHFWFTMTQGYGLPGWLVGLIVLGGIIGVGMIGGIVAAILSGPPKSKSGQRYKQL